MPERFSSLALALVAVGSVAALLSAHAVPVAQPGSVSFPNVIDPILERSCRSCHGDTAPMGRLDLSSRESLLRGGTRGVDLVPGNAAESRLYRRVAGLEQPAMPAKGAPLTANEIAALKQWIDEGAQWDAVASPNATRSTAALAALENRVITAEERNYWAFKLPVQSPLPDVDDGRFSNPIDRFLEAARRSHAVKPAPRADRNTLVRRAYLDLLGLPPTPAQVEAFVADRSPDAWAHLIDSLLASPHYGERYGRLWLDVARYADSAGFEYDTHRPNAWRYRDYVIKSFNDDKPYDRFLIEQIAGDEMDGRTNDSLVATGFLRMGPRVLFREKDNPERRYDYLDEIIGTIGKGTLGLTVNCARCHNHKFDPIAQKDYYRSRRRCSVTSRRTCRWRRRRRPRRIWRRTQTIDAKIDRLKADIERIERPYRDRLQLEQIKARFPENVVQVARETRTRSDAGRDPARRAGAEGGERLRRAVDRVLTTEDSARKKDAERAGGRADRRSASTAADGGDCHRRRLPILAARRGRRYDQLSQVPHPGAGRRPLSAPGPGPLPGAAVVLPHPRRRREPRIADDAGLHRRHHIRQPAD